MANGDSFRWLVLTVSLMLWSGCSLQPLQQQTFGDSGRIEYRTSKSRVKGIAAGAPHGTAEPAAIDYASTISAATGAGLVVAYGFGAKPVTLDEIEVGAWAAKANGILAVAKKSLHFALPAYEIWRPGVNENSIPVF
ncbi:MAG: hypothetical protein ACREQ2_07735 [Candidatus Binatia bacterium]